MNDTERSARRIAIRPVERREWVRKYEASGLTQRAFGLQHGLKLSTLQYWVNRERRPKRQRQAPVFAEVKLAAATDATSWAAELVRPGGATLRVARDLSPALLEQLLAAC